MKSVLVFALLAAVGVAGHDDFMAKFNAFKIRHQRVYASLAEEVQRFETFTHNIKHAAEMQAANPLATFGVNALSDRTDAELKALRHLKARPEAEAFEGQRPKVALAVDEKANAKGASIDWRTKGVVGPVLNEGNCNSGWAISAAGNIEGIWAASGRRFVSASVQELLSCDSSATSCDDDFSSVPSVAFDWLLQNTNGTIATAASFPLINGTSCPSNLDSLPTAATIKSYVNITESEDDIAAYLYAHGPVSAVAYVTGWSWMRYTGGILTDCNAPVFEDFYIPVLVVGYDDTYNPPYWILKNSWGAEWGESGYIRMQKGVNLCHITQTASSVVLS